MWVCEHCEACLTPCGGNSTLYICLHAKESRTAPAALTHAHPPPTAVNDT